jgi:hypothetical protein
MQYHTSRARSANPPHYLITRRVRTPANTCRFVPTTPTFANQTAQGNRPSYKMSPAVIPSIIIKRKEARRLDPVDLDQIEALDTFSHIG